MRLHTDPETDAIAQDIYQAGGTEALLHLKAFIDHWEAPLTPDLPEPLRAFFLKPVVFPDWVDAKKLRLVQDDFVPYGLIATMTLIYSGFLHFLCNPAGARAFNMARVFGPASVRNRMILLPQFVINLCERGGMDQTINPDGTASKGHGIISVQKLRMAHAFIRIRLKLRRGGPEKEWDLAALGEPINQEDLAQAAMDLCLPTIEGLNKLGIHWSAEECEASVHFWKVVAFLLGLREDLQPRDLEEAKLLQQTITQRHARATTDGAAVARDVLNVSVSMVPRLYSAFPAVLMRYLCGPRVADALALPRHAVLSAILLALRPLWKETQLFAWVAKRVMPRAVGWMLNNQPAMKSHFRIPPYLAESWGIRLS